MTDFSQYMTDTRKPDVRFSPGGAAYLHYESTNERYELIARVMVTTTKEWSDRAGLTQRALAYRNARRFKEIAAFIGAEVLVKCHENFDHTWRVVVRGERHNVDSLERQLP